MRGGWFNEYKFGGFLNLILVLLMLDVISDQHHHELATFEPNPLDKSQKLFVEPFEN